MTTYALIAETEYYGEDTKRRLIGMTDPQVPTALQAAIAWAKHYNPDYDEKVGCCRLSHNQASATTGNVCEVIYRGQTNPYEDWSILPQSVVDAATRMSSPEDGDVLGDEHLEAGLAACNMAILADDGEGGSGDYVLVSLAEVA